MKVILSKDLNDIYIIRIDILDELKVIDKLYDDSHVLLYLFHRLMFMMIFFGLCESFIHPVYLLLIFMMMMFIQLYTPPYTRFLLMVLTHIFGCGLHFLRM